MGVRKGSKCGEGQCYIQIKVGNLKYYMVEHPCGKSTPTTITGGRLGHVAVFWVTPCINK